MIIDYIKKILLCFILFIGVFISNSFANEIDHDYLKNMIEKNAPNTGVYVLERGEDALLSRAWLADFARSTIEVQYFIWSTDNIGILATEALLRAAERGVKVRVIVDDLLIDAPDESLLALSKHPNIHIKIYNPKHSVGTPLHKRIFNLFSNFRGFNQRMHDKTFVVDGIAAITGGRNMADEYYDYNQTYNFRDRDVLLLGGSVNQITKSFDRFWANELSVPVEELYDGLGILKKNINVNAAEVQEIYRDLHEYANSPLNYEPEVRESIENLSKHLPEFINDISWSIVDIINDLPGKNDNTFSLGGGGRSSTQLAELVKSAQKSVLIQSPYVVLTAKTKAIFNELIRNGVRIQISTNSLASTDNLQAFSGYKNQRSELLKMGLEIYEYRQYPKIQELLMQRYEISKDNSPIFAIHAKTMVIDNETVYIGTFNLDPRSVNLNTETGAIIFNKKVAEQVAKQINIDIQSDNSWNAKFQYLDKKNSLWKKSKVLFWQIMPIKPLL